MEFKVAVLKGDGIGPEIVGEAVKCLDAIGVRFGHAFTYDERLIGGAAIDAVGEPLPLETVDACLRVDAVLLGAVGGPKWDDPSAPMRPEDGLLGIRKALGVYANLRPAKLYAPLADACPLKPNRISDGLDLVVCRELTGDVYFGEKRRDANGAGHDDMTYTVGEIERIARRAFVLARGRRNHVTCVDKANVLETSRVWREVVERVAAEYPDVRTDYQYVDNTAMQLVINPSQFDVILTGNLFGDILSDEASCITGSIGMLPSASLGDGKLGLYEPIHGSAPDIAGKGVANPIATILSVAMMLRYSFDLHEEADTLEAAVERVLDAGYRTGDIAKPGEPHVGSAEMGDLIVKALGV
ncbi:MAG: 3-isopropylmalate dehydrogenase [Eggerthellaceae bacterium]|nr:3-isopropylmalate dehydrogenase [Eggerthellaceae bacterium]